MQTVQTLFRCHYHKQCLNVEMTREHISFTLTSRYMLLSLQIGFTLIKLRSHCHDFNADGVTTALDVRKKIVAKSLKHHDYFEHDQNCRGPMRPFTTDQNSSRSQRLITAITIVVNPGQNHDSCSWATVTISMPTALGLSFE